MHTWHIAPPRIDEYEAWRRLFDAYVLFYRRVPTDSRSQKVWEWLHDPTHELSGLVAHNEEGLAVALAHYRPFVRPITGAYGGWIDDLFIEPSARGQGAFEAMSTELQRIATANSWEILRWITAENNSRARAKYDQLAECTSWVVYELGS